jgi:hypothetical protein
MKKSGGANWRDFSGLKLMDYVHPNEVVQDVQLSLTEKRELLSAWASDACAVESRPGFRWLPGTPGPILLDHIYTALAALDDPKGSSRDAIHGAMLDDQVYGWSGARGRAADLRA